MGGEAFVLKFGYTQGLFVEGGDRMEFQCKLRSAYLHFTNLASFSGGSSECDNDFEFCFAAFLYIG